jgi:hypothetical protein
MATMEEISQAHALILYESAILFRKRAQADRFRRANRAAALIEMGSSVRLRSVSGV